MFGVLGGQQKLSEIHGKIAMSPFKRCATPLHNYVKLKKLANVEFRLGRIVHIVFEKQRILLDTSTHHC